MNKEFNELNSNQNLEQKNNINKITKSNSNKQYSIVVGTFKYKKNAEKQLALIKNKYPKTTSQKNSKIALIRNNGNQLFESRFQFFTKQEAYAACKRLKKYNRDCFVRL